MHEDGALFGLFLGVALTSFLTGITEPLEFMFLFVSPLLYIYHSFLDGVSFLVADLLNISIGNTFSGGFIDFTLFGILQGNAKTNWMFVPVVGVIWFCLYYFSFRFFLGDLIAFFFLLCLFVACQGFCQHLHQRSIS